VSKKKHEHMHGVDVCAYCAAGDLARAQIPVLEATVARVREEVERMRRAVEIMAGVESVAERVAQLRLVVARFDAALDGEGTK